MEGDAQSLTAAWTDFDALNVFSTESAFVTSTLNHGLFQTVVQYDEDHAFIGALVDSFGIAEECSA